MQILLSSLQGIPKSLAATEQVTPEVSKQHVPMASMSGSKSCPGRSKERIKAAASSLPPLPSSPPSPPRSANQTGSPHTQALPGLPCTEPCEQQPISNGLDNSLPGPGTTSEMQHLKFKQSKDEAGDDFEPFTSTSLFNFAKSLTELPALLTMLDSLPLDASPALSAAEGDCVMPGHLKQAVPQKPESIMEAEEHTGESSDCSVQCSESKSRTFQTSDSAVTEPTTSWSLTISSTRMQQQHLSKQEMQHCYDQATGSTSSKLGSMLQKLLGKRAGRRLQHKRFSPRPHSAAAPQDSNVTALTLARSKSDAGTVLKTHTALLGGFAPVGKLTCHFAQDSDCND